MQICRWHKSPILYCFSFINVFNAVFWIVSWSSMNVFHVIRPVINSDRLGMMLKVVFKLSHKRFVHLDRTRCFWYGAMESSDDKAHSMVSAVSLSEIIDLLEHQIDEFNLSTSHRARWLSTQPITTEIRRKSFIEESSKSRAETCLFDFAFSWLVIMHL